MPVKKYNQIHFIEYKNILQLLIGHLYMLCHHCFRDYIFLQQNLKLQYEMLWSLYISKLHQIYSWPDFELKTAMFEQMLTKNTISNVFGAFFLKIWYQVENIVYTKPN